MPDLQKISKKKSSVEFIFQVPLVYKENYSKTPWNKIFTNDI